MRNIIKYLDRKKFEIHIALIRKEEEFAHFLFSDAKVYNLNCTSTRYAIFKLVKVFKESSPDLIFSTLTYVNELIYVCSKFSKKLPPVVMRSAVVESRNIGNENVFIRLLVKKAYKFAKKIIVMTKMMKNDFVENFGVNQDKISVIPNPVDISLINKLKTEHVEHGWLVSDRKFPVITAMGRLTEQKGFEFLIKVFAKVVKKSPAKLIILGKGRLKSKLEKMVRNLGLEENVYFAGFENNPYRYIARSDLFVLSSFFEGFPNALVEAMACGVPVISTDCPSGPSEIITTELNGILTPVGEADRIGNAICRVLDDVNLRNRLSENAVVRAKNFDIRKTIPLYEKVFTGVCCKADAGSSKVF